MGEHGSHPGARGHGYIAAVDCRATPPAAPPTLTTCYYIYGRLGAKIMAKAKAN